ncbi:Sec1-like family protein [Heterostelium album PN500]|uniref:Sec1-like family protein n=1 Tax=Heterostelium pallidum (strain ATCC 26659 / Pp 5 / PN500) TaxID=670386 RepID=D3BV18_HETP5|nr:Sec1-like family protein [Heterostelium album PN500]EFA74956.1 Sec1-like family protein [Heterostelium album PN500]|eukprot:XP_020427090.1 Sec1-like family protein [Heterostelium album PN500]
MLHRTTKSLFIIDSNPIKKKHFNVPISPIKIKIAKKINTSVVQNNDDESNNNDSNLVNGTQFNFNVNIEDLLYKYSKKLSSPCDEVISSIVNLKKIRNMNEELLDTLFSHITQPQQLQPYNVHKTKSVLYIDPTLAPIMDLMIDSHSFLQKRKGITSIHSIQSDVVEMIPDGYNLDTIFIINDCIENINRVINCIEQQIKYNSSNSNDCDDSCRYTIVYFKRINPVSIELMERHGIQANHIEFPIDLIPLDSDLLSLQIPTESTISLLLNYSRSLLALTLKSIQNQLFTNFGSVPIIRGKGKYSKMIFNQLIKTIQNNGNGENLENDLESYFESLVLIDRHVDLITPLLIPTSYEALIDELFQIDSNMIVNKLENNSSSVDIDFDLPLSSNDRIFNTIRSLEFNQLVEEFDSIINSIVVVDSDGDKVPVDEINRHRALLNEMKRIMDTPEYLERLTMQDNLLNNRNIQSVEQYIFQQIESKSNYSYIMRFISLYSQLLGGISLELYSEWKYQIVQHYGLQSISHFNNLELAGLIKSVGDAGMELEEMDGDEVEVNTFRKIKENLKLYKSSRNDNNVSISVKIVERLINEWNTQETNSLAQLIPVPQFEFDNRIPTSPRFKSTIKTDNNNNNSSSNNSNISNSDKSNTSMTSDESEGQSDNEIEDLDEVDAQLLNIQTTTTADQKKTIIYFIGGVTYSEINSIRNLSKKLNRDFIICTTSIINTNKWINYFK